MSSMVATFFFELINVLLLTGFLGWLLFRPVRAAVQARQEAERQRHDALAAQEAEMAQQRGDLEHRLRAFETDLAEARRQRLAVATQEAAGIRQAAHEAAARDHDTARRALAQLERSHLDRLSAAVAAVTRESVARLLASVDGPDLDAGLARAAARQLVAFDERALGAVLVESAHPLDDAARAAVSVGLGRHADSVEFRAVPDLGVGLRIVTAQGLIDASARGIAQEAEQLLTAWLAVDSTGAMA